MDENTNEKENADIQEIDNKIIDQLRKESSGRKNDFEAEKENSAKNEDKKPDDIADKIIDNANKYFLVKTLSPEITNNEAKKRKHKDKLIKIVETFLVFQFFILICLLFGIIIMIFVFHGIGRDLELSYIETIIKFVSVYITSVVVELIAMLKYIVSNVFDTSITGLVEIYKDTTKEQENNTKTI